MFLQNIHTPDELNNYPALGRVFESFVIEEVIRGIQASSARKLRFYHFRTKAGGEIDLIVEGSFGLCPIEVKYSSHTSRRHLTAMIHFMELHGLPPSFVYQRSNENSAP